MRAWLVLTCLLLTPTLARADAPPDNRPMAVPGWAVDGYPAPPPPPAGQQPAQTYPPQPGYPQPSSYPQQPTPPQPTWPQQPPTTCQPCTPPPPPPPCCQPCASPCAAPPPPPPRGKQRPAAKGPIDRRDTLAFGLRGGVLLGSTSGPSGTERYVDPAAGLTFRWRPGASFALELSGTHASPTWQRGSARSQTLIQASAEVFFAPYRRLQPYVLTGITLDAMRLRDGAGGDVLEHGTGVGAHVGAGFELALGRSLALDAEIRAVRYLNTPSTGAANPVQGLATAGIVAYF